MDELSVKADTVATLESRLAELSAALNSTSADAEAKQKSLVQMQQGKAAAETELQAVKAALQEARNEHSRDRALLESLRQDVRELLLQCCLPFNSLFYSSMRLSWRHQATLTSFATSKAK